MRFTAKQLANIAVVTIVGLVATAWAVFGLAKIRFDDPKTVRVRLASSGGALPGAEVTYLGVPVGRVAAARLLPDPLELRLEVRPKGPMPRDLSAVVRQKTALGEPYVDLVPASPDAKPGDPDGVVIPLERTTVPRSLDQLLTQADQFLADVDPKDLQRLVEGGSGLAGRDDDLRAMVDSGARIGDVLSRRRAELGDLLASSGALVEALDTHRDAVSASLSSGARVTKVFADHTDDLVRILEVGGDLGEAGADLMRRTRADWEGVLMGLEASTHNLADRPTKTHEILSLVPPYLQGIAKTFRNGLTWSSNGGVPGLPYQPLYAIPIEGTGELLIDDIFLPSMAERIRADFTGGTPQGAVLIITPEEYRRASESLAAYEQVKREALERFRRVTATMRPGTGSGGDALD